MPRPPLPLPFPPRAVSGAQPSHHGHPSPSAVPSPPAWQSSAEERERDGDSGSVQTRLPAREGQGKALDSTAMLSSLQKHRLQIWKAAQFPNTTTNWKTHLKMKPAPALGFKVSCIRPNLPDGCICTTKRFGFGAERSLFWKSKHKTSPSSMPAGRRLAWQLGAKAGQGPILFPGCFPS